MKNILQILIVITSFKMNAQEFKSTQDSITIFYSEIFELMKNDYLYKDNLDWKEIENEIMQNVTEYPNFNKSLAQVPHLFDLTKADHARLYYKQNQLTGNFAVLTKDDFSKEWVEKYKTDPTFEVKIISRNVGYILLPGITFTEYNSKSIHNLAQSMYDEINKVKSSNKIKGWVIDLRFNTGGNIEPMLLALYDFLGNNDVWGVLDENKDIIDKIKLINGKYKINSKKSSYINPQGKLLDTTKVAIITNIGTGSSGEITALAFKGRENTVFIGQPTNGKTTSNVKRNLPFGAFMTLSIGFDCDRNGIYYDKIVPDIIINGKDNFDNLLLDGNIQEAIKFISAENKAF